MFSFVKIRGYFSKFLKPSLYMTGLDAFIKLWQRADAKERGILLLVFSPMFLCTGGLVFSLIYFVLFVLPSFLFGILGWGILTALFGAGGKYCYKYFTGKSIPVSEPEAPKSRAWTNNDSTHEIIEAQIVDDDK